MKKIIFVLVLMLVLMIPITSHADIEDDEEIVDWSALARELADLEKNSDAPNIYAKAAIVFDRESKSAIYEKNSYEKVPMASTTKIMTAIIAIEKGSMQDVIEVSSKAASIHGSRLGLRKGDKIKLIDLLYGLMLCSGNDAAVAISEYVGGSIEGFAQLMNEKAQEIGALDSNFITPHGLDNDLHYTTAFDLALITDYALENKLFFEICKTKEMTVYINNSYKNIRNTNELLGNMNGVQGVKTGFTNNAGRCLVTYCIRGELKLISVVLGCDTKIQRAKESKSILEYGFENYKLMNINEIIDENPIIQKVDIYKGKKGQADICIERSQKNIFIIRKDETKNIKVKTDMISAINAPANKGVVIGKYVVYLDEKILIEDNIILNENVERKNITDYFLQIIQKCRFLY